MKDLEADSLVQLQKIFLAVEEAFGLDIPDEEAEKFETVKDLVEYVDSHK